MIDRAFVHFLQLLSLLLGIFVWDGADEVVALAVDGDLGVDMRTMIRSTRISVSARLSSVDRSSTLRWVRAAPAWPPAAACAHELVDHAVVDSGRLLSKRSASTSLRSFILNASFFCRCFQDLQR